MEKHIEVKNAKIARAMLGFGDHEEMTCWLTLNYEKSSQGFGGYYLEVVSGMEFIIRILKTVGVREWGDLIGKNIRVKCEHGKVHAIGHIVEDRWFNPEVDLAGKVGSLMGLGASIGELADTANKLADTIEEG